MTSHSCCTSTRATAPRPLTHDNTNTGTTRTYAYECAGSRYKDPLRSSGVTYCNSYLYGYGFKLGLYRSPTSLPLTLTLGVCGLLLLDRSLVRETMLCETPGGRAYAHTCTCARPYWL